ncbi:MAG TPA: FliM/FliN family flagellar motor C-terminal domain-containing protein [Edaphobacter sp.]|jgi:flagellar motor switch protein FliM|nr:FliM/FliN family flagellar motor C-terminal domain-containing protein [Edaphobacter sp.]
MAEMELAKVETTAPVEELPPQFQVVPMAEAQPAAWMMRIEEHASWPLLSQMTVAAMVGAPMAGFKVGDLLRLKPGAVVESAWPYTEDVPFRVGRVQVGWSEFEVVDQRLLVRVTRLA